MARRGCFFSEEIEISSDELPPGDLGGSVPANLALFGRGAAVDCEDSDETAGRAPPVTEDGAVDCEDSDETAGRATADGDRAVDCEDSDETAGRAPPVTAGRARPPVTADGAVGISK